MRKMRRRRKSADSAFCWEKRPECRLEIAAASIVVVVDVAVVADVAAVAAPRRFSPNAAVTVVELDFRTRAAAALAVVVIAVVASPTPIAAAFGAFQIPFARVVADAAAARPSAFVAAPFAVALEAFSLAAANTLASRFAAAESCVAAAAALRRKHFRREDRPLLQRG